MGFFGRFYWCPSVKHTPCIRRIAYWTNTLRLGTRGGLIPELVLCVRVMIFFSNEKAERDDGWDENREEIRTSCHFQNLLWWMKSNGWWISKQFGKWWLFAFCIFNLGQSRSRSFPLKLVAVASRLRHVRNGHTAGAFISDVHASFISISKRKDRESWKPFCFVASSLCTTLRRTLTKRQRSN